jgi:hypothetical protein
MAREFIGSLSNSTYLGQGVCEILSLSNVVGAEIQGVSSKVQTFAKSDSDGRNPSYGSKYFGSLSNSHCFKEASKSVKQGIDKKFKVQFRVTPSDALFEAYVTVSPTQTKVTQVSRISEYKHMQTCRDETIIEQYCVCKQVHL